MSALLKILRRAACFLVVTPLFASPPCAQDPACLERLAAAGKLWATIKYFHPWLAWREIDWDAALLSTLPKVIEAGSPQAYATAVQAMLDALDDPATRVLHPAGPMPPSAPLTQTTTDGILLITLNPATLSQGTEALARLRQAALEIQKARAVVLDLRHHAAFSHSQQAAVGLAFQAGGLNHQLQFVTLKSPGHRSRLHSGLAASAPGGSLFFHSAFYVRDGTLLEARPAARPKPVVFLADESSCLPPIAPALQAAGQAKIVAQGRISDASLVERHWLELAHGLTVTLRVTELVYADGTTGLTADLALPADAGERALERALELARNPEGSTALPRMKLPPYAAPQPDKPYSEHEYPKLELRLLAAFRIWAAFRYFFAYRHLMDEDWDQVLADSLAGFLQAASARDYALAVAAMVARVNDSHAAVTSRALEEYFGLSSPPIRTRMIEGLPVVAQILDEGAARRAAVAPGDVILEVDGEEAAARMRRLGKYLSASTPQSLNQLLVERWLNGPPGSLLLLKLRDAQGGVREARLPRAAAYGRPAWRDGPVLAILPGNVGYADLDRLPPERIEELFEKFRHTRAIVFDLRGYPQGTAWLIAPRLTDRRAVVAARFRRPLALFPEGRTADVRTLGASWDFLQYLPDSDQSRYRGQTLALIDERAISQAEHAGLFLRAANGTLLVGSRTAGANGDVARFSVPGGIAISFSGLEILHPDGRQLQRVGLIPDLEVKPTIAGVRAGRDELLEKALEHLGIRDVRLSGVGEAR